MKIFNTESRPFQYLNKVLLLALTLEVFVPGIQAYGQIVRIEKVRSIPAVKPVQQKRSEATDKDPSIERERKVKTEQLVEMRLPEQEAINLSSAVGQPESGKFSIGTTEGMVDEFTGDFTYSIPLMDVEGYPLVISYNSNVSMTDEASWVGLGWNLNVGSVAREMRGIPDEFDGNQYITRVSSQLPDITTNGYKRGVYAGLSLGTGEILTAGVGINGSFLRGSYQNTYLGLGKTFDLSLGINVSLGLNLGIVGASVSEGYSGQLNIDSKRGVNIGFGPNFSAGAFLGPRLGSTVFGISGDIYTSNMVNFSSRSGVTGVTTSRGWSLDGTLAGVSSSVSSTIAYGSQTSVPRLTLNSRGTSQSYLKDRYVDLSILDIGTQKINYSSSTDQVTLSHSIDEPALGYFHSSKKLVSSLTSIPVMDFNRSNENQYSETMTNLPFSMQTFDIFYANAMGMQATFRGQRTDIGTYVDGDVSSDNLGLDEVSKNGFQLAWPTIKKEVGNGTSITSTESSELEKSDGNNVFEFSTAQNPQNNFDAAIYFKAVGEATPSDMSVYSNLGGFSAARPALTTSGDDIYLSNSISAKNGTSYTMPASGQTSQSAPIVATFFRPITVSEMSSSPNVVDQKYVSYPVTGSYAVNQILRNTRPSNVLTKVEVVSTGGTYYGYGIPNYSNTRSEVMFNIGNPAGTPSLTPNADRTISYTAGTDNSVGNAKGLAHLYDKTTVPAFAESFLLTEIHSSDYIDRLNDGPTLDDIGNYYKFNYTRAYDHYTWRSPMGHNKAFYTEGTLASELDDVASYVYGDKEIWYSHSIETKTLLAEFVLDNRDDGYGSDENGNLTGQQTKRLLRIELYNRNERLGASGSSAKPLQVVEFEYSYELCQNYPGNPNTGTGSGKLTLKAIKFYSGTSKETVFSKYVFDYSSGANNPSFNYLNVDAWGNYKPSNTLKPNDRFPYAEQSAASANANSKAWKLIGITVPSGGKINVDYESDSYAYVQDKRVMKHINLNSFTNIFDLVEMKNNNSFDLDRTYNRFTIGAQSISTSIPIQLITDIGIPFEQYGQINTNAIPNNIIVFKLETPIPGSDPNPDQQVKDLYFKDGSEVMEDLLVKLQVQVTSSNANQSELVPVFCTIASDQVNPLNGFMTFGNILPAMGVLPAASSGDYEYGYVIVEPVKVGSNLLDLFNLGADINASSIKEAFSPFQRASNDYFVRNLSDIVYGNTAFTSPNGYLDILTGLGADINKSMRFLGYAPAVSTIAQNLDNDAEPDPSLLNTIRAYAPSNIKFGGNARVKSITYSDNWNAISGETTNTYQWLYSYGSETETKGVASYESRVIRDESSFYQWDTYYNIRMLYPDELQYSTTPEAELLFPSGQVGYSSVTSIFNGVRDRGSSVSEFYTARDFPTKVDKTDIGKKSVKSVDKKQGRSISVFGFTQGFSIETNDFHGKLKAVTVGKGDFMTGSGEILSRVKYNYYGLNEPVKMMDRAGVVTNEQISVECDIHADSRKIVNEFISSYYGLERRWYLPSPFSVKFHNKANSYELSSFYSHALIKHTNRSASIKSVETEYLNTVSKSDVVVLDKYSGTEVLSSSLDEFNDVIYSVKYPAHWYYREFRNLQESFARTVSLSFSATGVTTPNIIEQLTPGDVIVFPGGQKAWFTRIYPENGGYYKLIEADGTEFNDVAYGTYNVRIVQGNRTNQLGETMQVVTTKNNPLSGMTFTFPSTGILNASALTYRDRLSALCDTPASGEKQNNNAVSWGAMNPTNPYLFGFRGDLVPRSQLVWQSERNQDVATHGVRFDGTYTIYTPFFKKASSGFWYPLDHPLNPDYSVSNGIQNWRKTGAITEYDQYGKIVESKDQLGIYGSVLYGFSNTLALIPEAQAVNARQHEIAYEGFEDYSYYEGAMTYTPHFELTNSLRDGKIELDNTTRHSGNTSLKIFSGNYASSIYKISTPCDPDEETRTKEIVPYVTECDCVPPFSPTVGDYVVGGWIKQNTSMQGYIEIIVKDASNVVLTDQIYYADGSELDGWQRIEGTFTIASNASTIEVRTMNNGSGSLNFDDVRLHPFQAAMTTTVYDPNTLLKTATHDGYNYTTFYNYDENLNLVRVRVETEKGIITLSETEMSTFKY